MQSNLVQQNVAKFQITDSFEVISPGVVSVPSFIHCEPLQWVGKGSFSNVYVTQIIGFEKGQMIDSDADEQEQEECLYKELQKYPPMFRKCAFKMLRCSDPSQKQYQNEFKCMETEVSLLTKMTHPHIIQCFGWWRIKGASSKEDRERNDLSKWDVVMISEYCAGGDLERMLRVRKTLSEQESKVIMKQLISALEYIYTKHCVIHRDLKPQNILFKSIIPCQSRITDENCAVKLADFGFAKRVEHRTTTTTNNHPNINNKEEENEEQEKHMPSMQISPTMFQSIVGTPSHMAYEIIVEQKYNDKADLWSVGHILYQCLTGKFVFHSTTISELTEEFRKGLILPEFSNEWSLDLVNLLNGLLQQDQQKRMSWNDLFQHRWLYSKDTTTYMSAKNPIDQNSIATKTKTRILPQVVSQPINIPLQKVSTGKSSTSFLGQQKNFDTLNVKRNIIINNKNNNIESKQAFSFVDMSNNNFHFAPLSVFEIDTQQDQKVSKRKENDEYDGFVVIGDEDESIKDEWKNDEDPTHPKETTISFLRNSIQKMTSFLFSASPFQKKKDENRCPGSSQTQSVRQIGSDFQTFRNDISLWHELCKRFIFGISLRAAVIPNWKRKSVAQWNMENHALCSVLIESELVSKSSVSNYIWIHGLDDIYVTHNLKSQNKSALHIKKQRQQENSVHHPEEFSFLFDELKSEPYPFVSTTTTTTNTKTTSTYKRLEQQLANHFVQIIENRISLLPFRLQKSCRILYNRYKPILLQNVLQQQQNKVKRKE